MFYGTGFLKEGAYYFAPDKDHGEKKIFARPIGIHKEKWEWPRKCFEIISLESQQKC